MGKRLEENVVATLNELSFQPVAAVVMRLGGGNARSKGDLLLKIGERALGVKGSEPFLRNRKGGKA
jgi:hypothetical protein